MFYLSKPLDDARNELRDTYSSHKAYFEFFSTSPVSQPYFSGFVAITTSFRFYFALKATRIFGRFTRLIKISAINLLIWLLFTVIFLSASSNFLNILLTESPGSCSSIFSCMKVLIEAGVGAARFHHLGGSWPAYISLMALAVILAAILMNMVIAKINSNYQEVSRRGTLHYYRELFELRYLYKLDPKYGYLVTLEHPFSLAILPTLCILKCFERKRKIEELKTIKAAIFKPTQFLYQERKIEQALRSEQFNAKWRCCLCFKCKKVNPRRGIQLEDFNHAMLRTIYLFNLIFFTLFFFLAALPLIPIAYISLIITKIKEFTIQTQNTHQFMHCTQDQRKGRFCKNSIDLTLAIVFGLIQIIVYHLKDTYLFARDCWRTESSHQFSSVIMKQEHFISQQDLTFITLTAKEVLQRRTRTYLRKFVERNIEAQPAHLLPIKVYDTIEMKEFMKFIALRNSLRTSLNSRKLMKRLKTLLTYFVLQRRATLPHEVPLKSLSRLLLFLLQQREARSFHHKVNLYNIPILQLRHRLKPFPLSFRLNNTLEERNQPYTTISNKEDQIEFQMLNSFVSWISDLENAHSMRNLFCLKMQKTIDGTSRIKQREDKWETLLSIQMKLEEVEIFQKS